MLQHKEIKFLSFVKLETIKALVINEVYECPFYPLRVLYEIMLEAVKARGSLAVGLEHSP